MSSKPLENQEKLCPFRKRYWSYAFAGERKYQVVREGAEVIEEEFLPCIKDKCIFYFPATNACRKN